MPGTWFEFEIDVRGSTYTVFLTDLRTGTRVQTTKFVNTDGLRGQPPGYIGLQSYGGAPVAFRRIRLKP